jgi:hypothetical protein
VPFGSVNLTVPLTVPFWFIPLVTVRSRQIEQELAIRDEKEFVILVVLTPMLFSLHHAYAHD